MYAFHHLCATHYLPHPLEAWSLSMACAWDRPWTVANFVPCLMTYFQTNGLRVIDLPVRPPVVDILMFRVCQHFANSSDDQQPPEYIINFPSVLIVKLGKLGQRYQIRRSLAHRCVCHGIVHCAQVIPLVTLGLGEPACYYRITHTLSSDVESF